MEDQHSAQVLPSKFCLVCLMTGIFVMVFLPALMIMILLIIHVTRGYLQIDLGYTEIQYKDLNILGIAVMQMIVAAGAILFSAVPRHLPRQQHWIYASAWLFRLASGQQFLASGLWAYLYVTLVILGPEATGAPIHGPSFTVGLFSIWPTLISPGLCLLAFYFWLMSLKVLLNEHRLLNYLAGLTACMSVLTLLSLVLVVSDDDELMPYLLLFCLVLGLVLLVFWGIFFRCILKRWCDHDHKIAVMKASHDSAI